MPFSQRQAKRKSDCAPPDDVRCHAVMTIDTHWFTDRLAERRMSQRQLAKHMGLDSSAVSLMFRGKRSMSIAEAAQIAVLLQSSMMDVLRAAGAQLPAHQQAPVIGQVQADGTVILEADGTHDMVEAPSGLPSDAVALQARTAGTEQAVVDGWLYFLAERQLTPDKAIGAMALCAVKGAGLRLVHVTKGYRRGTYNLIDRGGRVQQNVELAWASPVLLIKTA